MNDLELAEEIERKLGNMAEDFRWAITFSSSKWQQIIAALRRGPVCERCQGKGGLADWQGNWRPCPVCQDKRPPSGEMVIVPREPYWLIERGSPAEWWVRGMPEVWTADASKAQRFNEWGAKTHAKELESWGVKGPLWATEHLDCDGPLSAAEAEGRKS